MITAFLPLFAIWLSIASTVNAHGYIQNVTVGGKTYQGWHPFDDPYKTPPPDVVTRHVPSDGPIINIHDKSLACNVGGEQGTKLVADAPAGSKITFQWNQWLADHLGPVSTYMASCSGDCTKFDTANAKWFKIDAAGYDPKNKQWASAKLIANGDSWTSTIPSALTPGQYLVRHEVIALHDANQPQFYPSCTQIKVTGSGNQNPSGSSLVSIPGIYDNVKFPDIWADGFNSFTIPGPALFTSSGGNNDDNDNDDTNNDQPPSPPLVNNAGPTLPASFSSSSPSPTSTPGKGAASPTVPAASSTGQCRHNSRRSSSKMAKRHVAFAKRHH